MACLAGVRLRLAAVGLIAGSGCTPAKTPTPDRPPSPSVAARQGPFGSRATAATNQTEVVAHRGFAFHWPENTIAAIDSAFARGVHAVEVDIRFTADVVPVLMHDDTVDRTTNGRGTLRSYTAAGLARLDACPSDAELGPCPVPTLHDALEAARPHGHLYLDVKGPVTERDLTALFDVIDATDMGRQVAVLSFHLPTLRWIKTRVPSLALALLLGNADEPHDLENASLDAVFIPAGRLADAVLLRNLLTSGVHIGAYTARSVSEAREMVRLGVRWIISDVWVPPSALDPD